MISKAHHKRTSLKGIFVNLLKHPSKSSKHSSESSSQVSTPESPPSRPSLFAILPAELCIPILTDAAKFSQTDGAINPYSSALALCRVSRTARHIVLPEFLHTVLLSKSNHVSAFIYALEMQDGYAQTGNHLRFDYAPHVRRIWIGETSSLTHTSINFSLLAPVLFASKSLALDTGSMSLLDSCLTQVWDSHTRSVSDGGPSRPRWGTTTLTLAGDLQFYCPTTQYDVHALRSKFFASIDQFVFLPPTTFHFSQSSNSANIDSKSFHYNLPPVEVDKFPWESLKNPQTIVLALPRITLADSALRACVQPSFWDVCVTLETVPAPVTRVNPKKTEKNLQSSFDVRAALTFSGVLTGDFNWEQTWACRLSP